MTKEQQTPEMFTKLYDLTRKYTRILQPRYYKQYRGDIDDLASDYFISFIEPHGRTKKQTLLDSFDIKWCPKNMTPDQYFAAYVKLCVFRRLGGSSVMDPIGRVVSLDQLQEKCGDGITHAFDLAMQDEVSIDDMDLSELKDSMKERVAQMSKPQLTSLKTYYKRVKNALNPEFKRVFGEVLNVK